MYFSSVILRYRKHSLTFCHVPTLTRSDNTSSGNKNMSPLCFSFDRLFDFWYMKEIIFHMQKCRTGIVLCDNESRQIPLLILAIWQIPRSVLFIIVKFEPLVDLWLIKDQDKKWPNATAFLFVLPQANKRFRTKNHV